MQHNSLFKLLFCFCNALLAGLPASFFKPLQLIQNAAARLIFNESKRTHVTPLFINLHWLAIAAQCIKFKALMFAYRIGLCDVDKKNLSRFLDFFSISILITILTQTDMLYSYKCILCEFETYFQRKPTRPFPKSCKMSLEQTYGKIHIYIFIKSNKTICNMHFFFGHQVLILFWTHLPCFFSILSVCMPGLFCSRAQFRRAAFWLVRIAYCRRLGRGAHKKSCYKAI